MVLEYQLTTIVMLTRCVEDGKVFCCFFTTIIYGYTLYIGFSFRALSILFVYRIHRKSVCSTGLTMCTPHSMLGQGLQ